MIVILRPIAKKSWSGLIKYRNCYEDIGPYFTRSGRVYTGLTSTDETRLGSILGWDLKSGSEFWKDFFIRTSGKDLYLDTNDAHDELKYLFLKNHKRVKNSIMENKASANFVLINKDEEAKRTNLYSRTKREALKEFDKLTPEDMRSCLRLYGNNGDSMSNELLEKVLFDIVEGNPESFLEKWVNNKRRDIEALIERAIAKNIIRKNKNVYMYGTDIIGHSLAETSYFLEEPKNQDIKIAIMKQLESKAYFDIPIGEPIAPVKPEDIVVEEKPVFDKKGVGIVVDDEEKAFLREMDNKVDKKTKAFKNTI